MAHARNTTLDERNRFRQGNIHEQDESIKSVWEINDSFSNRNSLAPFAVSECAFNIDDDDPSLDDDFSAAASSDREYLSLPNQSHEMFNIASQPAFNVSEPWLRKVPLVHLKIITNGINDTNEAKKILKQYLKWIDEEETGPYPWRLGLTLTALEFKSPKSIDFRRLIRMSKELPYWLKFKSDEVFGKRLQYRTKGKNRSKISFENRQFAFSLSYGALIKMDEFLVAPANVWNDKDYHKCSISMEDSSKNKSNIDWMFEDRDKDRVKNQLFLMNTSKCVIIDLFEDGFALYIEQKCNTTDKIGSMTTEKNFKYTGQPSLSRTQSETYPKNTSNHSKMGPPPTMQTRSAANKNNKTWVNYDGFKRKGTVESSYFPTIRFSLQLQKSSDNNLRERIDQILSSFIQIFFTHDIAIAFGRINSDSDPKPYLFSKECPPSFLKNFLMNYAWHMLLSSGYRFHLIVDKKFRDHLKTMIENQKFGDELFYRVCVYLVRILLIQPFIDIYETLVNFEREFHRKQDATSFGLPDLLETNDSNYQYVPSVTITPTVLRVNPLKLCKTNRVLRDPFFGKALENFALVDIRDENGQKLWQYDFKDLNSLLLNYLEEGFPLVYKSRYYRYFHHTQSQVRQQQFWFYYSDTRMLKECYAYLGDFSNEKNPAKYAARMAQCFSTTIQTIEVPSRYVQEIADIYTADKKLMFSDGCGTISIALRDEIKESLKKNVDFSVVQLRYAGAKGVVSVDTRLTGQIKMNLRPSMIKFSCPNHSFFEVCKISAPRSAYLNRQAILLLSNRKIPDSTFLILQQRNYLSLTRHLLRNRDAERCILSKIPNWFLTADIHLAKLDYIHEPFFRQLLINASSQSARELLNRTRIRLPCNLGRYMFGIVDEYNVLKFGEVFVQYTVLPDYDSAMLSSDCGRTVKILKNCDVVITKNPCHHPGDVRRFKAADYPQLRHLKDVIVFSQQGDRPPAHDISGSDLDGDEYLVLWHPDLIPYQTENYPPYDYDSNRKLDNIEGPMEREIINKKILEIAELDCLGTLSNLHLAYADKFGINDPKTLEIAAAISEELDSAKTGYHPFTNEQIRKLSEPLNGKRPDFFNNQSYETYPSTQILGHLYGASKRTLKQWNRLFQYHRHLRHLLIQTYDGDADEEEEAADDATDVRIMMDESLFKDINFTSDHDLECKYFAIRLALIYRAEMLEILNLYGVTHESDIWCQSSTNAIGGELEDTAITELCRLVHRTRTMLFQYQVSFCERNCEMNLPFDQLCHPCKRTQRSVAVACYKICYEEASTNPNAAPILSLPWIISHALLQGRLKQPQSAVPVLSTVIAKKLYYTIQYNDRYHLVLNGFNLSFTKSGKTVSPITVSIELCAFIEVLQQTLKNIDQRKWMIVLKEFIMKNCEHNSAYQMIYSDDDWRLKLEPHRADVNDEYAASLLSIGCSDDLDNLFHRYVDTLVDICFERYQRNDDFQFFDISEKIVLLLQKFAIEETLN